MGEFIVFAWNFEEVSSVGADITLIKDMYDNVMTSIHASDDNTNNFLIRIEMHQRSALSFYLFALVIDEVTRDIQGDILCSLQTI
uniref:Uncharacterized protein n=1 Tax=Arundo donax TaxID=35708 RepID=A0A0A9F5N0_ARUDO